MVKVSGFSHRLLPIAFLNISSCLARLFFISLAISFSFVTGLAQDDNSMPDDVAPPPLKIISKEEKDLLAAETGVKSRAAVYLELMDERLKKAENLSSQDDFVSALTQFGSYEGLLENMMKFLNGENKSGKALSSFKKVELTLREHNIRIETVRRIMPFKYAFHITRLERVVRRSRAEATESLFSDSVVKVPPDDKKEEQKP